MSIYIPFGILAVMNDVSNKEVILEVSLNLFSKKGYDATGVQEIVTEAGITKPTLYHYFGNKKGILTAMTEVYGEKMKKMLFKATDYMGDPVRHFTLVLEGQIRFAKLNPEFFKLYMQSVTGGEESDIFTAFAPFRDAVSEIYKVLFKNSLSLFGNMKGYENLFARNFKSLVESTAITALNDEIKIDDDTVYRIIRAFCYGVAN